MESERRKGRCGHLEQQKEWEKQEETFWEKEAVFFEGEKMNFSFFFTKKWENKWKRGKTRDKE